MDCKFKYHKAAAKSDRILITPWAGEYILMYFDFSLTWLLAELCAELQSDFDWD